MGRKAQVITLGFLILFVVGIAWFFTIQADRQSATFDLIPTSNTCVFSNSIIEGVITDQITLNRQCSYDLSETSGVTAMLVGKETEQGIDTWVVQGSKVKCVITTFDTESQGFVNELLRDFGLSNVSGGDKSSSCFNVIFFELDEWQVIGLTQDRITLSLRIEG